MKRIVMAVCAALCLGIAGVALAGAGGFRVGEEIYVCGCGAKCPCDEVALKGGKCTCGKDLVKAKVTGVAKGKVVVTVEGKERTFKTVGKYACACERCGCKTVSQAAGKCPCGKAMKEAKQ
ncbi:hypothetical protein [Geobacter sp.]|uniref:hypothetical protein n=1 Tax=Geobacter sp. TaxID=46610 RepID=UPI0026094CCB|nr:hypothetical protein [Geobacter sp.]